MKKLITVSSVLALLAGSSAYAKTEGNYFGVDFLRSNVESKYKNADGTAHTQTEKFHSKENGYGINYKYAFNFGNNVFVAPGLFYDHIGSSSQDNAGDVVNVSNRYGVKLDIGYDVTDKVAVYFTNGFAKVRYGIDWNPSRSGTHNGTTPLNYFHGIGASLKVTENVLLNAEYNTQHLSFATPSYGMTARTKLDVMKIGLSFKF